MVPKRSRTALTPTVGAGNPVRGDTDTSPRRRLHSFGERKSFNKLVTPSPTATRTILCSLPLARG